MEEPKRFKELCEKIGLALMMGQKVQMALAHYFSVYKIVNDGWNKERAKSKTDYHLSKPMGVVIGSIEKEAPLEQELMEKVADFKRLRNWLVHDFDEESTPFISKGKKIDDYISKMEEIIEKASTLMWQLHEVGEKMVPVVVELIKNKFSETGSPTDIPKLKGSSFSASLADDGINVDNLGGQPFLHWSAFQEAVRILIRNGGSALRGNAHGPLLGEPDFPLDSVEGHIAHVVYGKKTGDTVFRRITPIACILIWAGICYHKPRKLVLHDFP